MRKGSDIIGLKVISRELNADDRANLGTVKDLLFDHETDQLLGLLISEKELFGLIDAQVVPWDQVVKIGADAIIVQGPDSKIAAHADPRISAILDRPTVVSGTKIYTTDGRDIGTFADLYLDENTGQVVGYEVSGGFVADTMSGKHFIPASMDIAISKDVALVPPEVADSLAAQKTQQPGGLQAVTASVGEKISNAYGDIATASIEKQKEFVVGKTAGADVVLSTAAEAPMPSSASSLSAPPSARHEALDNAVLADGSFATSAPSALVPVTASSAASGTWVEPAAAAILVRKGEIITHEHANRAEAAGILHQLVLAATSGAAGAAYSAGAEQVSNAGASAQEQARAAAIGKPAGRDVMAPDGTVIVAPGMIITRAMLDHAQAVGRENEVIAAAGVGTAAQGTHAVKEGASNLWDTIKQKASELSGAAHERKAEYDAQAEQSKVNNALGRPTTRVILDKSDHVILNAGDLITHAAVEQARAAEVLTILLDSVYAADPHITPEMLRTKEHGRATIESAADDQQKQAAQILPPESVASPAAPVIAMGPGQPGPTGQI